MITVLRVFKLDVGTLIRAGMWFCTVFYFKNCYCFNFSRRIYST